MYIKKCLARGFNIIYVKGFNKKWLKSKKINGLMSKTLVKYNSQRLMGINKMK